MYYLYCTSHRIKNLILFHNFQLSISKSSLSIRLRSNANPHDSVLFLFTTANISVFTFLTLQFSNTVEKFIPSIVSTIFHEVSASTFVEGAWNSISSSLFRGRVITIAFVAWIEIRIRSKNSANKIWNSFHALSYSRFTLLNAFLSIVRSFVIIILHRNYYYCYLFISYSRTLYFQWNYLIKFEILS